MPYVVTQSCCADASCVVACPVNCIHPAPGEPGFAEAEMLYVDARSCVDCGACLTACPVDAIQPHTALTPQQQPFVALNAEYYDVFPHPDRTPLALVPRQRRLTRRGPFRFAVVGSGPAGMYVADELLRHPEVTVDVIDRLPTPYGLVRAGVAPDHQATKQVTTLFEAIEREPGFATCSASRSAATSPTTSWPATTTASCTPSVRRTTAGSGSRGRTCPARSPPRTWSAGTTATPTSRTCASRSTTNGWWWSATATSRSTWPGSSRPIPRTSPRPTSPPCPGPR